MDKKEIIVGIYCVADCEHRGDIIREINYLRNVHHGIRIINSFWDGRDCGEAYIEFSFQSCYFAEIYNKIDAKYNVDINDYLPINKEINGLLSNVTILNKKDFQSLCKKYERQFDDQKITLHLFFEESADISNDKIINKAIETFGKETTNILAYSKHKTDRNNFVEVLFQTLITNISKDKLHDFGDYCLGSHGWLKNNHIYGEIKINSVLKDGCRYNDFVGLIKKISNKEPLEYKSGSYYRTKIINVDYENYIGKDNMINPIITLDDVNYRLKL